MTPDWTQPVELADLTGEEVHPDLVRMVHSYSQLSEGRAMPHCADFRPSQMRWMLGRLFLLDVLQGGGDYHFRLFGVFWQGIYGADLTGCLLSRLEPLGLDKLRPDYDAIVATGTPSLRLRKVSWQDDCRFEFQRLLLPYCDDSGEVCLILGAAAYEKAPADVLVCDPAAWICSGKPH